MTASTALGACAGFALFFLYANMFEYVLHRWVMHHPWHRLPHLAPAHTRFHHGTFNGGATYYVRRQEDRSLILLFRWWQAPLWVAGHFPLAWGLERASGVPVLWSGMAALTLYYGLMEYVHWCMHNPAGRWVERTRVFQCLEASHRLHHRFWWTNFNIFLPLGDVVLGTYQPR